MNGTQIVQVENYSATLRVKSLILSVRLHYKRLYQKMHIRGWSDTFNNRLNELLLLELKLKQQIHQV